MSHCMCNILGLAAGSLILVAASDQPARGNRSRAEGDKRTATPKL
jgi:hypothetical protein